MKNLLQLVILVLLFSGCAGLPVEQTQQPQLDPAAPARALSEAGKTLEAAAYYQALAEQYEQQRDLYRLLAAQSYLQSGSTPEALTQVEQINPSALSAGERNDLRLLKVQIFLSLGDAEKALDYLDLISVKQLNTADKHIYHQSRAFAYSLTGELLESARQRILLGRYLNDPDRLYDNNRAIYETLDLLSEQTLLNEQPPAPNHLGGWMALTAIMKQKNQNPENFELELTRWQHLFPDHPAGKNFLTQYLEQQQPHFQIPQSIAVFLPESGPYAKVAAVIRQGFDTAYRNNAQSLKPHVRFYDSNTDDLAALYQQAITNGADMIIGPLQKKAIRQIVEGNSLSIPVLALNHIPELQQKNLIQFGLSPIDEAEQIALQAEADGAVNALILLPDNDYGHRVSEYLNTSWQDKEGVILESQFYKPKSNDFSKPIKLLLNIDESETRYRSIQRLLPGVKFSPRTRTDAQALFLGDSAKTLRLLNPQLHFYRARQIPAYATSKAYGNQAAPNLDIDLNGLTFCTSPWILDRNYLGEQEQSINQLQQNNVNFPPAYLNLAALGMDAYSVLFHLNTMDKAPYQGATGNLTLTDNQRISRALTCAKFVSGHAQSLMPLIEASDQLSEIPMPQDERPNPVNDNPFHDQ